MQSSVAPLGEGVLNRLETLLQDGPHPALLIAVGVELLLMLLQIVWLVLEARRYANKATLLQKGREELAPGLSRLFDAPQHEYDRWVNRACAYPPSVRRQVLRRQLSRCGPSLAPRLALTRLYDRLGLLEIDRRRLSSRLWNRRLTALRRLAWFAGPQEKPRILAMGSDRYPIPLVVAQIMGQIGTPDELFTVLSEISLSRRLMEQPVFSLLKTIPSSMFSALIRRWDAAESPWLRRVLLITAGRRDPVSARRLLAAAAKSPHLDLRTAACMAASRETVPAAKGELDLTQLLADPRWEVRAQAAKALGRLNATEAAEPLADALRDASFWVRQNAAAALMSMDTVGRAVLEGIAAASDDRFAVDAAAQHLQRHRPLASQPVQLVAHTEGVRA